MPRGKRNSVAPAAPIVASAQRDVLAGQVRAIAHTALDDGDTHLMQACSDFLTRLGNLPGQNGVATNASTTENLNTEENATGLTA